jgi:hypothetical protein
MANPALFAARDAAVDRCNPVSFPGQPCRLRGREGFERTLAYVTGLANVRDAIPFPRTPGNAKY